MLRTVVLSHGEGYVIGSAEARKVGVYLDESAKIAHYRQRKTRNPSEWGDSRKNTGRKLSPRQVVVA